MNLRGKNILVVGGTSGIGRELVRQLQDRGNGVAVFARRAAEVFGGTQGGAIRSLPKGDADPEIGPPWEVPGDVRRPEDLTRLGEFFRQHLPDLDGIFYCTGVSRPDFVEAPDLARALDTIRVNFAGQSH